MTTRGSLKKPDTGDYSHLEPLPDPPREPDMQQRKRTAAFDAILMAHFAHRNDVLISGDGYLRRDPANEAEQFAPDCVVAFGVNPDAIVSRNGYVISEVGKPPDFVLEVASRSTGRRDYTVKRTGYAGYGVQEYWRFDRTDGRFHDTALAGDVLTDAEYTPALITREPDGLVWGHSSVLDLDLCWDRGELRLRDPRTGRFLPTPDELQAERDAAREAKEAAEERADTARVAREAAEERADTARVAREAAEVQVAKLESELRQLRGE